MMAVPVSWHCGENALGRYDRVLKELEDHVFVVVGSLRIVQDLLKLFEMSRPEMEGHVTECLLRQVGEPIGPDLDDLPALK